MTALLHHRLQHGVSRSWLAEQLGISKTTLWRYERGDVTPPKSVMFHAAHLLRASPEEIGISESQVPTCK